MYKRQGYTFFVFDSNDEAVTGQTFKIDYFDIVGDSVSVTQAVAKLIEPGNIQLIADTSENVVQAFSKGLTETLTVTDSVTEDDIDISFVRNLPETVNTSDNNLTYHFEKVFSDGFLNTYWTPSSGTNAYTNDTDNEGNFIYYVGTRVGSVTASESIDILRIREVNPSDSVSVTEVAQVATTFNRSISTTGTAQETAVVSMSVVYTDTANATEAAALEVAKPIASATSNTDSPVIAYSKTLSNSATVSENVAKSNSLIKGDSKSATDSVNSINTSKGITETETATESAVKSLGKVATDSGSTDDSGIGSMQDYWDPLYCSEDYVGTGWTFT